MIENGLLKVAVFFIFDRVRFLTSLSTLQPVTRKNSPKTAQQSSIQFERVNIDLETVSNSIRINFSFELMQNVNTLFIVRFDVLLFELCKQIERIVGINEMR